MLKQVALNVLEDQDQDSSDLDSLDEKVLVMDESKPDWNGDMECETLPNKQPHHSQGTDWQKTQFWGQGNPRYC